MIQYDSFELENGLQVYVIPDPDVQQAVINILYNVGSRDEEEDKTGFAHLFEHLMFGGSQHIPSYDVPLQQVGGESNAFTSPDITNYYLDNPNAFEFVLLADRGNKRGRYNAAIHVGDDGSDKLRELMRK